MTDSSKLATTKNLFDDDADAWLAKARDQLEAGRLALQRQARGNKGGPLDIRRNRRLLEAYTAGLGCIDAFAGRDAAQRRPLKRPRG